MKKITFITIASFSFGLNFAQTRIKLNQLEASTGGVSKVILTNSVTGVPYYASINALNLATTSTVLVNSIAYGSSTGTLTSNNKIFVDATNKCLVIGGNGSLSGQHEVANSKPQFELVSNVEDVQAFNMKTYGPLGTYPSAPGTQNDLHFYRYDGTQTTPTNTKKDMFLMSAGFRGWGTTQPTQSSVAIQVKASENWTDNAQGADVIIQNTANGTKSRYGTVIFNNDNRTFLTRNITSYVPYRTNSYLNIDLASNVGAPYNLSVGMLVTHTASNSASILLGAATNDEFAIFHYGASLSTFNFTGSNFPAPSATYFYGNSTASAPFYFAANKHAFAVGQTGTNPSMLIDAVGVKIGTVADVATSGTASLDLPASNTAKASLRIRTGVAPTSPNIGDIYSDGTHVYCYLNGVWKQLDN